MALNPNIILQGKVPSFEAPDPIAQYSKGLQLKGLMTQQNLQDQAAADDQATRAAYQSSGGDSNAALKSLISGGQYKAAQALQKQMDEQAKSKADIGFTQARTGKTLDDVQVSKIAQHRDELANVNSQQDAELWAKQGLDQGLYPGGQAQYQAGLKQIQDAFRDPVLAQQWKQQAALGATKYIQENAPKYQTNNLGGKTVTMALPGLGGAPTMVASQVNTQSPDSIASTAVSRENSIRSDNRQKEANAQSFSKPFEVTGPDGKPILVRQDKQGNVTPVEGFSPKAGAPKSLTETQGKATGFAARMQDASKIIEPLEGKVSPLSVAAANQNGITGVISNYAAGKLDPQSQLYQQAQENWVTANLRLESGAAIGKEEKEQEIRKWFPQPGDTQAKIQQKANARKVAERAMVAQTGPGASQISGIVNGDNVAQPKTFSSLPDPASLNGKRIQAPDGSIMRSNGSKWIQEK